MVKKDPNLAEHELADFYRKALTEWRRRMRGRFRGALREKLPKWLATLFETLEEKTCSSRLTHLIGGLANHLQRFLVCTKASDQLASPSFKSDWAEATASCEVEKIPTTSMREEIASNIRSLKESK
jgi:hypothetical protein